jgi:hypothetical protein
VVIRNYGVSIIKRKTIPWLMAYAGVWINGGFRFNLAGLDN